MSDLSARQAAACENARTPSYRCKCRCGGKAHGMKRGAVTELPAEDPHHVKPKVDKDVPFIDPRQLAWC